MSLNFAGILDTVKVGEVERPKPLPTGDYIFNIKEMETGQTREKKTDYLRIIAQPIMALESVNPDDLEGVDLSKKTVRKDFFLTEDALFILKEFLEKTLKIDVEGLTFSQAIPLMQNQQFGGTLTHRIDEKNPEVVYIDLAKVYAVE